MNIFSDGEEPIRDVEAERQRKREAMEVKDRAELERNVKTWKQQTEEVEARFEGGPPKKLKVGEQTIGALLSPAALPEEGEEDLKNTDLEIDEDEESKSFYLPEEEPWEEELGEVKPITEEERQAGKRKSLKRWQSSRRSKWFLKKRQKERSSTPPGSKQGSLTDQSVRDTVFENSNHRHTETMSTQYPQLPQLAASLTWSV